MALVLPGPGAGVEVPALCQPQGLCSRAAVEREFSAGEIVFWSCLFGLFLFGWFFFSGGQRNTKRFRQTGETAIFSLVCIYDAFCAVLFGNKSQACAERSWSNMTLLPELQQLA